jgi:hypothetical protein
MDTVIVEALSAIGSWVDSINSSYSNQIPWSNSATKLCLLISKVWDCGAWSTIRQVSLDQSYSIAGLYSSVGLSAPILKGLWQWGLLIIEKLLDISIVWGIGLFDTDDVSEDGYTPVPKWLLLLLLYWHVLSVLLVITYGIEPDNFSTESANTMTTSHQKTEVVPTPETSCISNILHTMDSVQHKLSFSVTFLVVWRLSCLPLDPSFTGSNPAEDDRVLRAIQIPSTTSFGGEVKPSVPCRKIFKAR